MVCNAQFGAQRHMRLPEHDKTRVLPREMVEADSGLRLRFLR
jgi:hypothetical protein